MPWTSEEITRFESIVTKLAGETHLAKPDTDEGLLPIFSLVNELSELPQDPAIGKILESIEATLHPMLNEAQLFDEASIEALKNYSSQLSDALIDLSGDATSEDASPEEGSSASEQTKPEAAAQTEPVIETIITPSDDPFSDLPTTSDEPALETIEAPEPASSEESEVPTFEELAAAPTEEPEPASTEEVEVPTFEELAAAPVEESEPISTEEAEVPTFEELAATPAEEPEPVSIEEPELPTIEEPEPVSLEEPEPISFEDASQDLASEGDGPLTADQLEEFSKLSQQFSGELLLAEKGSDEGMLPVYSLLKDFESEFSAIEFINQAVQPVSTKMDQLLDAAQGYDDPAIKLLTEFNIWLETARIEICGGYAPKPFEPTAVEQAASAPEAIADDEPEDDLVAEFSQFDVIMDLNMEENQELLVEFHTEAVDHLGQIETAVLELEQDVTNGDAIASMFRSFHTIKGVAGFLNLIPVNRLAHEVESLMDLVRNDELGVYTGIIDLVLESKDTVAKQIEQISDALSNGSLPSDVIPVSRLMARARWAMEGPEKYAARMGVAPPSANVEAEEITSAAATETGLETPSAPDAPEAPTTAAANAAKKRAAENASIRVNTWKLDNLMDMVGELVIVQSQLDECSKEYASENSTLQRNMAQLVRITKDLQHTSMALRMIPIKQTFQKMGRIVRDLSAKSGKKVRFQLVGEDTELDRNVVEEIGDPLVHMVRNALDHGLEPPEERAAAGKDETGFVALKAYHQGSNIVIELSDNGRGIDADKVLQKAIANGVVREDEQLSKEEIYKLIFAPGFSMAEKITDISGRGVGMDVVRKNIEKLRGKIEIESNLGQGSTFKILLPLTMAIVDGLVVKVGEDRFILPTTSVKVALRPDQKMLAKIQGNEEVLNIRGKIIPLFRLHNHFQIPAAVENPRDATVVVVETAGRPFGLLVDDMVSKQEVVIKSLGSMMQGIPGVSGGAILGDGTIALILDPASLISAA